MRLACIPVLIVLAQAQTLEKLRECQEELLRTREKLRQETKQREESDKALEKLHKDANFTEVTLRKQISQAKHDNMRLLVRAERSDDVEIRLEQLQHKHSALSASAQKALQQSRTLEKHLEESEHVLCALQQANTCLAHLEHSLATERAHRLAAEQREASALKQRDDAQNARDEAFRINEELIHLHVMNNESTLKEPHNDDAGFFSTASASCLPPENCITAHNCLQNPSKEIKDVSESVDQIIAESDRIRKEFSDRASILRKEHYLLVQDGSNVSQDNSKVMSHSL